MVVTFVSMTAFSQHMQFSLASDVSVLRSFKKEQRFWAVGQTVAGHFNFAPKEGLFAWLSYYSKAQFSNYPTATARLPATIPQEVDFMNRVQLRLKHVSLGWKHYFKGGYNIDIDEKWSLYGYAGFGILFGNIINTQSLKIDTANYVLPVLPGEDNFTRLTVDLGLGFEKPVGGDIYLYMEGRVVLPTTDYPTQYLLVNDKAPFTAAINLGFRMLFD